MNYLTLLLCLVLPWLAGALGLRLLWSGPARLRPLPSLLLGYGYFIGVPLAGLLVWLSASLLGRLSTFWVLLPLALLAGLLAWLVRVKPAQTGGLGVRGQWLTMSLPQRLVMSILLFLLGLHLLFSLLEILVTPLFPWDAWTVWVYRAKAWFLQNQLFEFLSPGEWIRASGDLAYTQPALRYPLLPSLIPLWAAMGLGRWHEALINLPVILCAVAIALAVFGQLRMLGVGLLGATLAVYLLLSTPLFATHMSLGGYADIWMAGFAGLAYVALMGAAISGRRAGYLLGAILLLISTQVKLEGLLWLTGALAWSVLSFAPRRLLLTLLLVIALLCAVFLLLDIQRIALPGSGEILFFGSKVYLPLLGWREFQVNDLRMAYLENTLILGSWNLVWLLLLAVTMLVMVRRPLRHAMRPVLSFLAVLVASQLLVFVFSTEGAWARDYTAINRLPLQLYPAVIFSLVWMLRALCLQPGGGRTAAAPGNRQDWAMGLTLSGLSAAGLLVLGAHAWLVSGVDDDQWLPPVPLGPQQLQFVLGEGQSDANGLRISAYQQGLALLSSGPVKLDASRFSVLEIDLETDPETVFPDESPAFFWRRLGSEAEISRITLDGRSLEDLSRSTEWNGEIVELGLVFMESSRQAPVLRSASLHVPRPGHLWRLLPAQWLEFEPWTQRSAHVRTGGAERQLIWLPALLATWLLLAVLAIRLFVPRGRRLASLAVFMLCAWLLLDLQWLLNRERQFERSLHALTRQTMDQRQASSVLGQYYPWLVRLRDELLLDGPDRILIINDPRQHKYYGLRANYQLLPHMTYASRRVPSAQVMERLDYVLFLGDFMTQGSSEGQAAVLRDRLRALPLDERLLGRLELVDFDQQGMLFEVLGHAPD